MNFNNQDRHCFVTLSAAKGLSRWAQRCFAALSMIVLVLIVKNLNVVTTPKFFGVVTTNHLYVVGRTKYVHWANSCRGETSTSTRSTVIFAYLGNSIHATFLAVRSHHQCTSK